MAWQFSETIVHEKAGLGRSLFFSPLLSEPREVLCERLGRGDLFAYPNGTRVDFTATTKELVRQLSYKCGLATIPGLNNSRTDLYELRRVNIGADTRGRLFEMRMSGL